MEMNPDRFDHFSCRCHCDFMYCAAVCMDALLQREKEDPGSRKLKELSSFIHEGAMAF